MKIPSVSPAVSQAASGALMSAAADPVWADSLTVGQILKARVLRQFGQGRYELDFAGRSRVVDSAVPLSVGDLLHGRVVGLGERVVIERTQVERGAAAIHSHQDASLNGQTEVQHGSGPLSPAGRDAIPDVGLRARLARIAAGATQPELIWKAGAFASRFGFAPDDSWLRRLSVALAGGERLDRPAGLAAAHLAVLGPSDSETPSSDVSVVALLTEWLRSSESAWAVEPGEGDHHVAIDEDGQGSHGGSDGASDHSSSDAWLLRLLNAQTGATFQHRYQVLPVVIDGRLFEFDVALFDHACAAHQADTRSRRIAMKVDTPSGTVDVEAIVVGGRVSLSMASGHTGLVNTLQQAGPLLDEALSAQGWTVERADYLLAAAQTRVPPARAVVEHVLEQDSLRMEL